MARRSTKPVWTPNQVVAYRIAEARRMRGWTQEQAAAELEPYLGTKLSTASFSAIERSFAGGRIRQFNADEILALSRGFRLPIGWFFTPPPAIDEIGIAAPDLKANKGEGWDPLLLLEAILGNPDTLPEWEGALRDWAVSAPGRMRVYSDTRSGEFDKASSHLDERVDTFLKTRARVRLGELLGDVDRAKDVLAGLVGLLDELDDVDAPGSAADEPAPDSTDETKGAKT